MLSLFTAEKIDSSFKVQTNKDQVKRLNSFISLEDEFEFLPFSLAGRKGLLEIELGFDLSKEFYTGKKYELLSQRSGFSELDDTFILSAEFFEDRECRLYCNLLLEAFYKSNEKGCPSVQRLESGFVEVEDGSKAILKLDPKNGYIDFAFSKMGIVSRGLFKNIIPSEEDFLKQADNKTLSSQYLKASTLLLRSIRVYDIDILSQFLSLVEKADDIKLNFNSKILKL